MLEKEALGEEFVNFEDILGLETPEINRTKGK